MGRKANGTSIRRPGDHCTDVTFVIMGKLLREYVECDEQTLMHCRLRHTYVFHLATYPDPDSFLNRVPGQCFAKIPDRTGYFVRFGDRMIER